MLDVNRFAFEFHFSPGEGEIHIVFDLSGLEVLFHQTSEHVDERIEALHRADRSRRIRIRELGLFDVHGGFEVDLLQATTFEVADPKHDFVGENQAVGDELAEIGFDLELFLENASHFRQELRRNRGRYFGGSQSRHQVRH